MSLKAKSKADDDKIGVAVPRPSKKIPPLNTHATKKPGKSSLADLEYAHLQAAAEKLARKFGVATTLSIPKIPYRETIKKAVKSRDATRNRPVAMVSLVTAGLKSSHFQGVQDLSLRNPCLVVPFQRTSSLQSKRGSGNPSVNTGAGYPVIDISVNVYDGSYHPVDSSEMAFKLAANLAYRKRLKMAGPFFLSQSICSQ